MCLRRGRCRLVGVEPRPTPSGVEWVVRETSFAMLASVCLAPLTELRAYAYPVLVTRQSAVDYAS